MPLPGVGPTSAPDPLQRSSFRTSYFQPEGVVGAIIIEGVVIDINLTLWTVDVASKFDQKQYFNIQIGSPYLHSNFGEGIYVMPDLGAKCHVCIPSDGPPPFVLDFIMPAETIPQAGPQDISSDSSSDSTFAGGRSRAKPGDIYIKGRDGNFVILHRGGVLQVGCSELAQRVYIPLQNLVTDISQNYRHYNTGGSINWFLASGESETNPSTIHKETYRLLADDEKASIRVSIGPAKDFVAEPSNGANSDLNQLGIGTGSNNPIVFEVVLSPEQFGADKGSLEKDTSKETKLRYFFDKKGGAFLRSEGSVLLHVRKKLRIVAQDNIDISTNKSFTLTAKSTGRIDGGDSLDIRGKVTKINGGSKPVATVGSIVEVRLTLPLTGMPAAIATPVVIPPIDPISGMPVVLKGVIVSGNPTILG